MDVVTETIGMVKTNIKGFYKDTINILTRDCPVFSYLVLKIKSTVLSDRLLIYIGYKYNAPKVIFFITTEYT